MNCGWVLLRLGIGRDLIVLAVRRCNFELSCMQARLTYGTEGFVDTDVVMNMDISLIAT